MSLNVLQQEIKKAIKIKNTTIKQMSSDLGYDYHTIRNQLSHNILSYERLYHIAEYLDLDIVHLMKLKQQSKKK